jgi:hypothetical protein
MCLPARPGRWIVAPLLPQFVQRALARSLSLEAFGPHRMTATAQAKAPYVLLAPNSIDEVNGVILVITGQKGPKK